MTHAFHYALPGYDPRQILHDGCEECIRRGRNLRLALTFMDDRIFEKAWRRAYDLEAEGGDRKVVGIVSSAEMPLLQTLWGVQVQLEKRGVPLNGTPPGVLKPIYGEEEPIE